MKILMVGLGGIGQRHLRNLRAIVGTDLEIMAYRFGDNSQVLTDQLGIERGSNLIEKYSIKVFPKIEQALYQKPDAVFICNPSSLHVPFALMAAQAGCNFFIEKPLSHNMDHVEELINIVESKKLKAVVGYQMRFHPCLKRLQTLIQEHAIGKIITVLAEIGEFLPGWHLYEDYRKMYASRKDLGGGVILSQIHELDYINWLFGFPNRVFAIGGHLSSLDIDVEDTASILMECDVDGRAIPISIHMDYLQNPPSRTCKIVGEAGKILVDFNALTVKVFDSKGNLVENSSYMNFQRNQMFLDELKSFLEYLQADQTSLVTIREAAQSLMIGVAVKNSLLTEKVINLRR